MQFRTTGLFSEWFPSIFPKINCRNAEHLIHWTETSIWSERIHGQSQLWPKSCLFTQTFPLRNEPFLVCLSQNHWNSSTLSDSERGTKVTYTLTCVVFASSGHVPERKLQFHDPRKRRENTSSKNKLAIWPQRPRYIAAAVAVHREGGGTSQGGKQVRGGQGQGVTSMGGGGGGGWREQRFRRSFFTVCSNTTSPFSKATKKKSPSPKRRRCKRKTEVGGVTQLHI